MLTTAMILAAGRGERMRPLTDETPKPLLHAGGRALIDRHLDALGRAGFTHVVINTAWLGDAIRRHVGDGTAWNLQAHYSDEGDQPLETAGGIAHARGLLGDAPFAVVNADIFTNYPFERLALPTDSRAHLVLVENPPWHPAGDFRLARGRVDEHRGERLTFAGIGVYDPSLFAGQPAEPAPLGPLLHNASAGGWVTGEHYRGEWRDIGTPERLAALDAALSRRGARG